MAAMAHGRNGSVNHRRRRRCAGRVTIACCGSGQGDPGRSGVRPGLNAIRCGRVAEDRRLAGAREPNLQRIAFMSERKFGVDRCLQSRFGPRRDLL
jgi:hypothetical protein